MAAQLEENTPEMKQYLIKHKWTYAHMNDHQWFTDKHGNTCYGPQTDNDLINTKGVYISPVHGWVWIAHFDQHGATTKPYIWCSAARFKIED